LGGILSPDLTHSGTQLGLTAAARFLPVLIFGPGLRPFADRRGKRRLLLVTPISAGPPAAVLAVLSGVLTLPCGLLALPVLVRLGRRAVPRQAAGPPPSS
jgi:MFS family permease